jgi:hypothetical protein
MSSDLRTVELDRYGFGLVLSVLKDERNRRMEEGRPTEIVDEVFLKIAKAPSKNDRGRDEAR